MNAQAGNDYSRSTKRVSSRQQAHAQAKPSALLMALVRRARFFWLSWIEERWAQFRRWRDVRRANAAAQKASRNQARSFKVEGLEPKLLLSADLAPGWNPMPSQYQDIAASAQTVVASSTDAGPTMQTAATVVLPTIQLSGPGQVEVQVIPDGGYAIKLTGTTAATTVTATGDTRFLIKDLQVSADVGSVNLGLADLRGSAQFSGRVSSLTLGQIQQSTLTVEGAGSFALKASTLQDTVLNARNAAVTLTATEWLASTAGSSRLTALTVASATVSGDFAADLFVSGPTSAFALGAVSIGGTVQRGIWSVHGRASSISVGASRSDWRVNVDGALTQLVSKGDLAGDVAVAALQVLQVGGSARALHVMVGANLGDDAALGGTGTNTDSFKAGTLARLRVVGDVVDSSFFVSIDPTDGVLNDGNDAQLGGVAQRLQEFTVGGSLLGRTSIVAPGFPPTVRIGAATLDPSGLPQFRTTPADLIAPALTAFGLAPASDTGVPNDRITDLAKVQLIGTGEPAARAALRRFGSASELASGVVGADGTFSFSDIALELGETILEVSLSDAAGNTTTGKLSVTRIPPADQAAPTLNAQLANDTGSASNDSLTSDPSIAGRALDNAGVAHLYAALDPSSGQLPTVELAQLLGADGSFTLSRQVLDTLAGGTLSDGAHTVRLMAKDAAGNVSAQLDVSFVFDSVAPGITGFNLAAASDTGTPNDRITDLAKVDLLVEAEPGATAVLRRTGSNTPLTSGAVGADGKLGFTDVSLDVGITEFTLSLTDAAGNTRTSTLSVTRTSTAVDQAAPTITAGLANDTGTSATDGQTRDPSITGKAIDNVGIAHLYAIVDGAANELPSAQLDNLLAQDGSFTLTREVVEALIGGKLSDGAHLVRLQAADAAGNKSAVLSVQFTLDSVAPDFSGFALSSADATNAGLDETSGGTVQLKGTAEPGAVVRLEAQGLSTTAAGNGSFVLPGVQLNEGANVLTLTARDVAGNATSLTRTLTRTTVVQADQVLVWNTVALRAIQQDVTDPEVATRTLAMINLAQYDALAAIDGTPAFLVQRTVGTPASAHAAAAVAAHRILSLTYPAQKATFDAALATALAGIPDSAAKDTGIALGLSVADGVWSIRSGDGSADFAPFTGSTEPGKWRPTAPMYDVAEAPEWATVIPFVLSRPDQYRPPAPPALDSAAYAADVNEIKALGSANSTTRTADQTQQAHFWADGKGSYTPPGHWNLIAAQVAQAKGNSLSANARLFAQLNVAMADAAIAAWDAKYYYGAWRPETAIQLADTDGNAATTADPNWTPLMINPSHPDYVSGHSTFSNAAAAVLASAFGDNTAFTTISVTLPNVTRSFTSFSEAATEAGRSRIYGGIHFQYANDAGKVLGQQVAAATLARFSLQQDKTAPTIVASATPGATRTNLTLTGQVLDNLSGVALAQYRIDSGAAQTLALDANGNFSITTALALDGTADGTHTLTLVARDAAGNESAAFVRSFTLDTKAPTVTLTSIAAGDALSSATRLTGAASPTGTTLTQLSVQIDSGISQNLVFDAATGTFDEPLFLRNLSVGEHTLTVTAVDAAGNTSTLTRAVKLEALPPLTITALTPTEGSGDVGVTVRPQVRFSRAVNVATLTADSFYATGPDGSRLAATIVPASDGSYAWLFFTNPMPGGSQITLHLDGSKIRGAADGSFLDADGNGTQGGELAQSFTTVSRTAVAGTKLVGKVVDPGPDLEPMTFDDIRRGPDGVIHTPDDVFLLPIAHAKVYILGQEDRFVYTDANGNFELTDLPAGTVKVAIDGRTATNAPNGVFFPEMVMDAQLRPGVSNTLMGSMGTVEERLTNLDRKEVYLPRVQTSSLQAVSDTAPTVITVTDAKSAPQLTEQERSALTLKVNPGSAIGENGQVLQNVQIGLSTVPPELVRDMLPPGVMQHTFDITIQAPGVATFAEPVQITFPNVFGAAPGEKLAILSFDHTTGMLVINGTGTVSADGLTVVSDPDSGIKAPGWHGVAPPGECGGTGGPPEQPRPKQPGDTEDPATIEVLELITADGTGLLGSLFDSFFEAEWKAPDALPDTPTQPAPPADCPVPPPPADPPGKKQPYIKVNIAVDGPLAEFMKSTGDVKLDGDEFKLVAGSGDSKEFSFNPKTFAEIEPSGGMSKINENRLYGSKITIKEVTGRPDGTTHTKTRVVYVTRYIDATDSDHEDAKTEFSAALVDGVARTVPLKILAGSSGLQANASGTAFTGSNATQLAFDPTASGANTGELRFRYPNAVLVPQKVDLAGQGALIQRVYVDVTSLVSTFEAIASRSDSYTVYSETAGVSAAEIKLFDNLEDDLKTPKPSERLDLANAIANATYAHFATYSSGIATGAGFGDMTSVVASTNSNFSILALGQKPSTLFGTSSPAGGVDDASAIKTLMGSIKNYSPAERAFRLDAVINNRLTGQVDLHPDTHLEGSESLTREQLIKIVSDTAAHEYGHTLGLAHTYKTFSDKPTREVVIGGIHGQNDMMMGHAGSLWSGPLAFTGITNPSLLMAANMVYGDSDIVTAIDYYTQNYIAAAPFSALPDADEPETPDFTFAGARISVTDTSSATLILNTIDFGPQPISIGQSSTQTGTTKTLRLFNYGSDDFTLKNLISSNASFSFTGLKSGDVIKAGTSANLIVKFNPSSVGGQTGRISIQANEAGADVSLDLQGFARPTEAFLTVERAENNLGGLDLSARTSAADVFVLRNDGLTPLSINDVLLANARSDIKLVGLPADLATHPVTLAFGETLVFGVEMGADRSGLTAQKITVRSNASNTPDLTLSVTATGFDDVHSFDWGNDFIAIEVGGNTLRTTSDAAGNFSVFLPANSPYKITVFDPDSGLVAQNSGVTRQSGRGMDLTSSLIFKPSTASDSDFDGLPDDIEFAIGTNRNGKDTDRDGLDDFTEIQQGLDPLGGLNLPVGVLATSALQGSAEAVATLGATSGAGTATALVATGSYGLAVVDASSFTKPRLLSQLDLAGTSVDIAADGGRGIAAVAGSDAGLHLIDISTPAAPKLLQTVALGASVTGVVVRDGIAYAIYGSRIAAIDLNTGDVRSTLDLASFGGSTLTDIAADGTTLYTMDSSRTLRAIAINGDLLISRDSLTLANGGGNIFVGGGIAYVGTTNDFNQGFSTVDVRDPGNISLLSDVDAVNVAGQGIAANGSGLLVNVGNLRGPQGQQVYALDVLNGNDPTNTGAFLTRINLPSAPKDIALANGLAFVANGSSGLQIVNYAGFDTQGVAPVVSIVADALDADVSTPGVQVLEGRAVRILPSIRDDVQVRNVELLINGQVVSTDVAFPWELFAQAPTIAASGTKMTIQVRATDTGGNVGLSNLMTLDVVPDTFAPALQSVNVEEGARRFFVKSVDFRFDEPLDVARLTTSAAMLTRAGADGQFGTPDDVALPVSLDFRSQGQMFSVLTGGYLAPGEYQLRVAGDAVSDKAGNKLTADLVRHFTIRPASDVKAESGVAEILTAPSANPGQQIGIGVPFDPVLARATVPVIDAGGNLSTTTVNATRWDAARGIAYFTVPLNAVTGDVTVFGLDGSTRTDFPDGTFPLQIVPRITDVQVQSVSGDGSTAVVVIKGRGFVEGSSSEYRFGSGAGSVVLTDTGANIGPDVQQIYDSNLGQYFNGQVTLTVPLSSGVFGPISIKTAGGTSSSFSLSLASIQSTALSGTPADAALASANPGQAVTLVGTGLTTDTDVLHRYVDYNGNPALGVLHPISVSADGTRATLVVPTHANGAFSLQIFGSANQPVLQVVPVLRRIDGNGTLYGAGFVEGASTFNLPGATITDSVTNAGVDVSNYTDSALDTTFYSGLATLNSTLLPRFGMGSATITTAGGTSAPLALNALRAGSDTASAGQLGDVAIDPVSGALWASDTTNPGHLLRLDPATGAVLQTLTLTAAFGSQSGSNYTGLQILSQSMTLGGTTVPAGSLLLFQGNSNSVTAVDLTSGAVIKRQAIPTGYAFTAGVFDAATGHLFALSHNLNQLVELNVATGVEIARFTVPVNVQSWAGMAIDPTDGNFWIGSSSAAAQLVKISRSGVELRRVDFSAQGLPNVSGLAFAADGTLRASTNQGLIYKLDLGAVDVGIKAATLTQVLATQLQGNAANAAQAAANVGQVIELVGTNFGANTQVLFNTRDASGNTSTVAVRPNVVDATGTRLQVTVPNLASTGDIRVVNTGIGASNLGFASYADAIYRGIATTFVAGSSTATIRFSDGGLQALGDESWGLDNVVVRQGATEVFRDSFEGGAKANWSNTTTNKEALGTFGEFSGRFNNAGQALTLTGLTAGQTYTLNFDAYLIDTWDGTHPSNGPDALQVSVDGAVIWRETFANYYNDAQTVQSYGASAGIRLQIVPTLASLSAAPGTDSAFTLTGSGFMEGATSLTVGGMVFTDPDTLTSPFDVYGARNDTFNVVAPRTLDGPVRVTTDGGWAELPGFVYTVQPLVQFSGISSSYGDQNGSPVDATQPWAVTGQNIVLAGQGFTSSTLVQFQAIDDTGRLGTITRTGSVSANGTVLTVEVPALARTGDVTVLGSGTSIRLQVAPTLRSVGGTVAAGNTLVLEGTGLTANDLVITIDGQGVGSFTVRTINDSVNAGYLDQQLLTLTVPNGVSAGVITVSTAGGTSVLRTGSLPATTALSDLVPTTDIGDVLATATATPVALNQTQRINANIASGLDVDLYRVDLSAGDLLKISIGTDYYNYTYGHLRLFDGAGRELASHDYFYYGGAVPLNFAVPSSGSYYIGLSGYGNTNYDPKQADSGTSGTANAYSLLLERQLAGGSHVSGITASASSGTPAAPGIASANVGQTITINGTALLANDQVVFTVLDDSGNLSEQVVSPASVAADGKSLSVLVPVNATTGRVRLARDVVGSLLQIVPTLTDVAGNGAFTGGTLTLTGSGFAESGSTVLMGNARVADVGRHHGLDVYSNGAALTFTVPPGAPSGPLQVRTAGGTSAPFGLALSSIDASAAQGSAVSAAEPSANPGQSVTLNGQRFDFTTDVIFETVDQGGNRGELIVRPIVVSSDGRQAKVIVPMNAVSGRIRVAGDSNGISLPLQIVPVITDVQVQSVAGDGSTAVVVIKGSGFVEGNNAEYRFGTVASGLVVTDAGAGTGPDVQQVYDPNLGQYFNGQVTLTVPLSSGVFGPISIKTAGGTSSSFSLSLTDIQATALSGTPADAALASANPGQAITLVGTGLTTDTDVLLRTVDYNGNPSMRILRPVAASTDGTRATLIVPDDANGAFQLQLFGSATQPLLQIVPVLRRIDANGALYGAGFVEGASTFSMPGASLADTAINAGVDISNYYDAALERSFNSGLATLNATLMPRFGMGSATITTAGGTSAPLALNALRAGSDTASAGQLGDVAIDPVSGALWASDTTNPGHLLRLDPATGAVLQTLTLTAAFGSQSGSNYTGLQILSQAMTLGGTTVPAGSLLLFQGNSNSVTAIDLTSGAVIKRQAIPTGYAFTAGVFDATTGHLFALSHNLNQLVELNVATGVEIARFAVPVNVQSWAGMAIDPTDGNFWIGSSSAAAQLVKISRSGVELRRVDFSAQGLPNVSGLAFAADGTLRASTNQGLIYKLDLGAVDVGIKAATLTQVLATQLQGNAANAAQAAANVGQVIELVGTNFGANTQVLFNTRDASGNTSTVAVRPNVVDATGTRLQVTVPNLASTGDIRVVNTGIGASNLGFASYADAIYRGIATTFVAGSSTATIRFSDGGLQALGDESWGLDNVVVRQGATEVFRDSFEGGAKANWSNTTTNKEALGTFGEFSGRFNNAGQALTLTGLTAGQTYTLNFDAYLIDTWDGTHPSNGPDALQVSVDGAVIWRETFANYYNDAQTVQSYGASAGIRLQIVPTLASLSAAPGTDSAFTLTGSGFMEGATSLTVGGMVFTDPDTLTSPFDVYGARNDTFNVVAPRTLDGPVRVTTDGGWAELPGFVYTVQPLVQFSGISSSYGDQNGSPVDATQPWAVTGQNIVLAGQGFTSSTLVQFQAIDDTGRLGTITRTGSVSTNGTVLTVEVPALARTGDVTVLGSGTSIRLQVAPTLRSVGGTVAAGNTLVLEGTGLTANDLVITIDGQSVGAFSVRTLNDSVNTSYLDQQLLTLTVPNGVSAGVITVSTAGGSSTLRSAALPALVALADLAPATDVGDTLLAATNLALGLNQSQRVSSGIDTALDVDLYRLDLNAGDLVKLAASTSYYAQMRLFDAAGKELASNNLFYFYNPTRLTFVAPTTGTFYIGISGYGNSNYNPSIANSGTASSYTYGYTLDLERQLAGASHLTGITASATSGTPTNADIASANIGQTITLNGNGLLASDQVVFSILDDSGNLSELTVTPTSVAADGKSLSVVVPVNATTGRVRLARDVVGSFLQIVPVITDVNNNSSTFVGGSVYLTGSGFAEGSSTVLLGSAQVVDRGRSYGLDVSASNATLNFSVPPGVPSGPIRVRTAGGTSAMFGLTLTGISVSATQGAPVDSAQSSANAGQVLTLSGQLFDSTTDVVFETVDQGGNRGELIVRPIVVSSDGRQAKVIVPMNAVSGRIRVAGDSNGISLPLQIVPVITDVQVQSVAGDGSTAVVVIKGSGFVEGNNAEYRFGTVASGLVVTDAGAGTGPDVQQVYDPNLGQYFNGQVTLTVPLSSGVFGPISIKTAGGTSSSFSLSLTDIQATALSGTPADAALASANPGQAITLVGTGLTTDTDVLLRTVDYNGNPSMRILRPVAASTDGTRATLIVPDDANGAFQLQLFGSATQPLLQIVPVLRRIDANGALYGAGFVEGASTFSMPGASLADTAINAGVDISNYYDAALERSFNSGLATLNATLMPRFGMGSATITTAGGTSAPLALNALRAGSDTASAGQLGDVAIDPVSGALWASDTTNPGHLLRLDPATGAVLQTLTLTAAFGSQSGSNYTGLQILSQAMTLGGTTVPAGSLLLFQGNSNSVTAIDLTSGAVIKRQAIPTGYAFTAGVFDATTGHLFALSHNLNQLVELNVATGVEIARFAVPVNVQSWAGMAIDPTDGNFWIGSSSAAAQLVKISRSGVELRRVDFSAQGLPNVSGLAFAADGTLRASTNQGLIYKLDLGAVDVGIKAATLTQVLATQLQGNAANAAQAAANVGQVIELVGTNFGANTQVLFNTRDASGNTSTVAVRPNVVDATGTRLQVTVPNLASTGDIRVVNTGSDASTGIRLQIVPTLASLSAAPGTDSAFTLTGSGFMEGATSLTVGGMVFTDPDTLTSPFDVYGARNDTFNVVAPRTLDGPVRVATDGGWAELPGFVYTVQPLVQFSGISSLISDQNGAAATSDQPWAVTGQNIVLSGQGFTSSTLVQFQAIDDTGRLGTITRTGSVSANGTVLTVEVPALARTGDVTVLGSGTSIRLQVAPTLRSVGGTVAAGNTLVLEGTGLTANDLVITIDGQSVGAFSVRTLNDSVNTSYLDQQLLTLTVPNGVSAGVITVSTAGGSSTLRSAALPALVALADLAPATDVGDTLLAATNLALGLNQSQRVSSGIDTALDVDLYRLDLNAGDLVKLAASTSYYAQMRLFDAAGKELASNNLFYFYNPTRLTFVAPTTGTFYIGISGYGNSNYNPSIANSGTASSYTYGYTLDLERQLAGASHLTGITASATSGTPTNADIASANIGQTIILNGNGMLASDQVVFSILDDSGNLSELTVTPTSVAADGKSLSVVVPVNATTGRVRLARDVVGSFLQIVPTVTAFAPSGGTGFVITGTGFAEGASAVLLPTVRLDDSARGQGLDVYGQGSQIQWIAPTGASRSQVRVWTIGGTSAVFPTGQA